MHVSYIAASDREQQVGHDPTGESRKEWHLISVIYSLAAEPDNERSWHALAQRCGYRRGALAKLLLVSERTLDRYFKKRVSMGAATWLRELQLRDAYQRILAGSPLKEVAFDVGFKQASHFTRSFRARFGFCPSVLRGSPADILMDRVRRAASVQ